MHPLERRERLRIESLRLSRVDVMVLARKCIPVLMRKHHADLFVERTHREGEVIAVVVHPDRRGPALGQHDVQRGERGLGVVEKCAVPVPEDVLHRSFNASFTAPENARIIDCMPRSFGWQPSTVPSVSPVYMSVLGR